MSTARQQVVGSRLFRALFLGLIFLTGMTSASADALSDIKARGKLVVGVKKDVPLWGVLDPSSNTLVGLEPDLAKDLADRLGVKLELRGLITAERIAAIEQGTVDVLIATLADTPDRRALLTLTAPHYYASGVNILARKTERFTSWSDLRNRRICSRRGAFYNRPITVQYGADIVALYGNELSHEALRDGRCSAVLRDETGIAALLTDRAWADEFEMPLATLQATPWSVGLHRREKGGALEKIVSNTVASWHREGKIKALQTRWNIPPSKFVDQMNERWTRKINGVWFCGEQPGPATPAECF
jgi:polar amino acid transport system substrate-binding protein